MIDSLFSTPEHDLGIFVAGLVGGRSRYEESRADSGDFLMGEYIVTNPDRKLPIEQLEAEVRNYLLKRGFISPQREIDEGYIRSTFSCLRYFHDDFPRDEWTVLVLNQEPKRELSVTLHLHPRQGSLDLA